jgi:hypothetical protein
MNNTPSIDLHPENMPGDGPEAALRALRVFLDKSIKAGHKQVRIITGLGTHGDGTPRLRSRVENDVLPGYFQSIEQQSYEQGGAVIKLWLKAHVVKPAGAYLRHSRREQERSQVAVRESRFMVAWDRLDAAETALEEGDLRRCRLKLNQLAKEFGWEMAPAGMDGELADQLLDSHTAALKKLDA